eukprot:6189467-Pleurochrysis_carterae.AAC.1
MDMMPVSVDVRVEIFKYQASITALEDAVTVMEKMRAIIGSENLRNASDNKHQFTASMTAELRTLQADVVSLKSGDGGSGEVGCVSQAYTAKANKRSYTREAGSQKNGRTKPPTSRGRTPTNASKCYFEACNLQHTGICFVQYPWLMPPDFPRLGSCPATTQGSWVGQEGGLMGDNRPSREGISIRNAGVDHAAV